MGSLNNNSPSILPKISKRLAIRTLALVVVVGGLVYGLEWFLSVRNDLGGLVKSDTAGWISAVQYMSDGQQAVLISPDGTIHREPGFKSHTTDRDLVWSPHGNFLYFISDRTEHNFNLFRWAPSSEKPAEQRTTGTRARSNPTFPAQGTDEPDASAKPLLSCGGLIQQFDPSNSSTQQLLPPTAKEIAKTQGTNDDTQGGIDSQFAGVYGKFGTSFREAQWCGGGRYIAGVMRRESGEILVVQDMQLVDGKFTEPKPLTAGEHIEFDVNPKTGDIVYAVQKFQWPERPPTGVDDKPMAKPFTNGVVVFELSKGKGTLISSDDKLAFGSPQIRPDGTAVAVIVGPVVNGAIDPEGLVTMPTAQDPNFRSVKARGKIHEPSWSPDGNHLIYALRGENGKRSIYDLRTDDNTVRNVTGEGGDFGFPRFSPQVKSKG